MLNNDSKSPCAVLYVDDEEKALKYFRMAFSPKFEVFTATSGAEGLEILNREGAKIGIVLSDQRMPEMLGADFLGRVRNAAPNIVRILTTAYSDLDSAIQAVNRGHIYQYVVKPWKTDELGMVLQRAADYHQVLSERDALMALKMTTLQRVICSDRMKWLLLHVDALEESQRATFRRALAAMIKAMPDDLRATAADGAFNLRMFEPTELLLSEYRTAVQCREWLSTPPGGAPVAISGDAAGMDGVAVAAGSFLSTVACGGNEVSVDGDRCVTVRIQESNLPADGMLGDLFGLFVERQVPEISIRLLQLVVAVAAADASLVIQFSRLSSGDSPFEVVIAPRGEAEDAEQVIRELYERFSASDIARM